MPMYIDSSQSVMQNSSLYVVSQIGSCQYGGLLQSVLERSMCIWIFHVHNIVIYSNPFPQINNLSTQNTYLGRLGKANKIIFFQYSYFVFHKLVFRGHELVLHWQPISISDSWPWNNISFPQNTNYRVVPMKLWLILWRQNIISREQKTISRERIFIFVGTQ